MISETRQLLSLGCGKVSKCHQKPPVTKKYKQKTQSNIWLTASYQHCVTPLVNHFQTRSLTRTLTRTLTRWAYCLCCCSTGRNKNMNMTFWSGRHQLWNLFCMIIGGAGFSLSLSYGMYGSLFHFDIKYISCGNICYLYFSVYPRSIQKTADSRLLKFYRS